MSITKIIRSKKSNEKLLPILNKVIEQHYNETNMKHVNIHPSQIGGCLRKQLIMMLDCAIDGFDAQTFRKFHNGNYAHERIQGYIQLAKEKKMIKKFELEVELKAKDSPDKNVKKLKNIAAKYDGIVTFNDNKQALIEIKSMNTRSYYKPDIHKSYIYQAEMYMLLTGFKEVIMIKECKDDQTWKEYIVKSDPKIKADCFQRISKINMHIKNKTLPPKICKSKSSDDAKYCNCTTPCFNMLDDFGDCKLTIKSTPIKVFKYVALDYMEKYPSEIKKVVLRKMMESCMRNDNGTNTYNIPSMGYMKKEVVEMCDDMRNEKRLFDVTVKWK
jgi:hypothetical protein